MKLKIALAVSLIAVAGMIAHLKYSYCSTFAQSERLSCFLVSLL